MLENVQENLKNLDTTEKWGILQLMLLFMVAVGFGLFVGTLFIQSMFGSGISFFGVFSAMLIEGYFVMLLSNVKERQCKHADFFGGVGLMMNVLLLHMAVVFGDLAGGLELETGFPPVCTIDGSASERFITVISSILFVVHLVFSILIILWKEDLLASSSYKQYSDGVHENGGSKFGASSSSSSSSSSSIPASPTNGYQQNLGGSEIPSQRPPVGSRFVIDDEDAEL